jgi:hypothetical protein
VTGVVTVPPALKARYQEGRLVPFVGAGASMSVTWTDRGEARRGISWTELVDHAAELLGFSDPDLLRVRGTDLQILEYYKEKNGGEVAPLRNWFSTSFKAPDEALKASAIHTALAKLTKSPVVYTTNYDDYIERAFNLAGRTSAPVVEERHIVELLKADSTGIGEATTAQIVKFHGDLDNPARMVLSESDYDDRMRFDGPVDRRLTADALGRVILFVGYSFRDSNVSYLFRLLNDQLGAMPIDLSGRRGYILIPDPSAFEYTLFRARNIEVVPIRTECMAADTAQLLESLLS